MAAQIEVVAGPDKGWRFTVAQGRARIGRGAGREFAVTDPDWPDGYIEVEQQTGGYLVRNRLTHAAYLDGKPFPPGATRTFHHGAVLQPTAGTLFRLEIVAVAPATAPTAGEAPDAPRPGRFRRVWPWLLLAVAVGWHAADWFQPEPAVDGAAANELKAALQRAEERPKVPKAVRAELQHARLTLTDAVFYDAAGRRAEAAGKYQEARDGLARVERAVGLPPEVRATAGRTAVWDAPDDDRRAVASATAFVGARLRVTTREANNR